MNERELGYEWLDEMDQLKHHWLEHVDGMSNERDGILKGCIWRNIGSLNGISWVGIRRDINRSCHLHPFESYHHTLCSISPDRNHTSHRVAEFSSYFHANLLSSGADMTNI